MNGLAIQGLAAALILCAGCGRGLSLDPGRASSDAGGGPPASDPRWAGNTGEACGLAGSGGLALLAISPDEVLIALAYVQGRVDLHATANGDRLRSIQAHQGGMTGAAFLPDGSRLVTSGADGAVRIWRLADGVLDRELRAAGGGVVVSALALSLDGTVAVAIEHVPGDTSLEPWAVQAWSTRDGTLQWALERNKGGVTGRFSPFYRLAEGFALERAGGRIEVLRWRDGQVIRPLFEVASELAGDAVAAGRPLAEQVAGARRGGTTPRLPVPVAIAPDGKRALFRVLLRDHEGTLIGFELTTMGLEDGTTVWRRVIPALSAEYLRGVALSPTATELLVILEDHVQVWDASDGRDVARAEIAGAWSAVAFVPGGMVWLATSLAANTVGGGIHSLDLRTGAIARLVDVEPGPRGLLTDIALIPGDDLAVAAIGGTLRMFDLETGRQLYAAGTGTRLAASPVGSLLGVSASGDPTLSVVRVIDLATERAVAGCPDTPVAFAPDGASLYARCGVLSRRRLPDLAVDLTIPDSAWPVAALAVSPDGRLLAAAEGGTVETPRLVVWNVTTGSKVWSVSERPGARFASVAFSPDSRHLVATALWPRRDPPRVVARSSDTELTVYLAGTGSPIHRLGGARAGAVTFSPDGSLLAAASDRGVRVWRTDDWTWQSVIEMTDGGTRGWWHVAPAFDRSGRLVVGDPWGVLRRYCNVGLSHPPRPVTRWHRVPTEPR